MIFRIPFASGAAGLALALLPSLALAQAGYTTNGTCDGLPRVDLGTPTGMCVGLVSWNRPGETADQQMVYPRTLAEVGNNLFVLVDMGGWAQDKGKIFKLSKDASGKWKREKYQFANPINQPHGVARSPVSPTTAPSSRLVYVATNGGIFAFDPVDPQADAFRADFKPADKVAPPTGLQIRVPRGRLAALQSESGSRHPLAAIAFSPDGKFLYVNRGSASDNCEKRGGGGPGTATCAEAEVGEVGKEKVSGVVRRYPVASDGTLGNFDIFSSGLRNSMALAVHPSGLVLQAENSRDRIDKADPSINDTEEPREELNVLVAGGKYGWPYCYNDGVSAPEFPRFACSTQTNPVLKLPAHVAPLGLAYYFGSAFPDWYKGKALVSYHGYREYGQKLVAVPTDTKGRPTGEAPFEIINNWAAKDTTPQGSPTGVTVASDGSVFFVDDKNKAVLRLAYDKSKGSGLPTLGLSVNNQKDDGVKDRCANMATRDSSFTRVQREVIDPQCSQCHGLATGNPGGLRLLRCDDIGNAKRLLEKSPSGQNFIVPKDLKNSIAYISMAGGASGIPAMPAGGLPPEQLSLVETWIQEGAPLPTGATSSDGKATSSDATIIKLLPLQASALRADQKCSFPAGGTLGYKSKTAAADGHFKLELTGADVNCPTFTGTVYVFGKHFSFTN